MKIAHVVVLALAVVLVNGAVVKREPIFHHIGNLINEIGKPVKAVVDVISKPLRPIVDVVVAPIKFITDPILTPVRALVGVITNPIRPLVDPILRPFMPLIAPVVGLVLPGIPDGKCTNDNQCKADSKCFSGKCVCNPGLFYSNEQKTCLKSCDKLVASFIEYPDTLMRKNTIKSKKGLTSENCAKECGKNDKCVAFSFKDTNKKKNNRCFLHSKTAGESPADMQMVNNDGWSYFQRICA